MNPGRSHATIQDVAKAAGVSISSVSRALNGQTSSQEMIDRVRQAAESVGYVPSATAQSMRRLETGTVALSVEDIGNPAYLDMVRGIQPVVRDAGLRLILHSSGGIVSDELDLIHGLSQRYVDGLIICPLRVTPAYREALENSPVPVVVIGSLPKGWQVNNVTIDSAEGGQLAVDHLVERGAKRIGFVNGPQDTTPGRRRIAGYRTALQEHGLPLDDAFVRTAASFQFGDGYKTAHELLAEEKLDAVVGANDRLALGAIHAAKDLGLSVPADLRVVGMDDGEQALMSLPPLTSVNLAARHRGGLAAGMLVDTLRQPEVATSPQRVSVAASLTARESTR